jgi:hypothetical protein
MVISLINVGSEVLKAVVMKSSILQDITACSPLKVNRRFAGTVFSIFRVEPSKKYSWKQEAKEKRLCLLLVFTLISCLVYSSTFKIEAIYSSEMSVEFQRTTRRYIPHDRILQSY